MNIKIPEFAFVVLVGASGSGKSTFAKQHFKLTEVLSSDYCRGLVSDDENNQAATKEAFELLHHIASIRLKNRLLTVVDATNVQSTSRTPLVKLARKFHCIPVAIVLNLPENVCQERNEQREDRNFGPHVVRHHTRQLRRSLRSLKREGFRYIFQLKSLEEVDAVSIERTKLWNNRKEEQGPFDIIGDIHGCASELEVLLGELGYTQVESEASYSHPEGRKVVFLGDLMDRGPRNLDVFRTVKAMVESENALCVPGNHDVKLVKKLKGKNVNVAYGLQDTLSEIEALPEESRPAFEEEMVSFIDGLISHYVLDKGKLVVAHAGLKESMQGRASGAVRQFALYGETTGETDEFGLPVRHNWAAEYRGETTVVYGHTPVPQPEWLNNTINIDTGCVFGGQLTALRYPEMEIVQVPAAKMYAEPAKPFMVDEDSVLSSQQMHDKLLHLDDVQGKRIISTRLRTQITIQEENAAAALEVMSRFAINPKWLIYLPPTMSPSETSALPEYLEHPTEAFTYYQNAGVKKLLCEEKHMGSRSVIIVCKDEEVSLNRFGINTGEKGVIYTRTGRRFFDDAVLENEILDHIRTALDGSSFWEKFETDWVCLDCELMPWSVKAQELIEKQYAKVGAASEASLKKVADAFQLAAERGVDVGGMETEYKARLKAVAQYRTAYRHYCWPVNSIEDIRVAPFHILATEGQVHVDKTHHWHMDQLAAIREAGSNVLYQTALKEVDLTDESSIKEGVDWWEAMVASGGEGMVVKPEDFIVRGKRGILQPAIKCRGPEYLRIIYGPEYTFPVNLERLKKRSVGKKRSLALREFALGVEALERFVNRKPLRYIHECVFAILALESEPIDPRL